MKKGLTLARFVSVIGLAGIGITVALWVTKPQLQQAELMVAAVPQSCEPSLPSAYQLNWRNTIGDHVSTVAGIMRWEQGARSHTITASLEYTRNDPALPRVFDLHWGADCRLQLADRTVAESFPVLVAVVSSLDVRVPEDPYGIVAHREDAYVARYYWSNHSQLVKERVTFLPQQDWVVRPLSSRTLAWRGSHSWWRKIEFAEVYAVQYRHAEGVTRTAVVGSWQWIDVPPVAQLVQTVPVVEELPSLPEPTEALASEAEVIAWLEACGNHVDDAFWQRFVVLLPHHALAIVEAIVAGRVHPDLAARMFTEMAELGLSDALVHALNLPLREELVPQVLTSLGDTSPVTSAAVDALLRRANAPGTSAFDLGPSTATLALGLALRHAPSPELDLVVTDFLVSELQSNPQRRDSAFYGIANAGRRGFMPYIEPYLQDRDMMVRRAAFHAASRIAPGSQDLTQALMNEKDVMTLRVLYDAALTSPPKFSAGALERLWRVHGIHADRGVRQRLVALLGQHANAVPSVVEWLQEQYRRESDVMVIAAIIQSARMVPNTVGDNVQGFKLFAIKDGTLFDKVGLKNGDVVVAVNNTELNADNGFTLYQAFLDDSNITLSVLRDGKEKETITIEIK